ncbi:D-isomer specific 2-hydroxyacid dehydrogenase NAD-binding domain [Arabidopsis thaliana x Arabidopsis arenosa]|uniref:D-isomer specific 2-hydroxyacid dehydrogenase NAD-binding domain n=1 Tax=Arabidopsis thaliana x Arabidopsis arenosa TaxID=1240361 RepID=A0A8T1Y181_9BRAS|nr:D-isomer specific 2-hydroxyacid dehydrogenase NAD-binding domain [Arabidopsis thaliana x Arabidopsis arenosa]
MLAAAVSFSISVATYSLKHVTLSSTSPLPSANSVAFPSRGRNSLQRRFVLNGGNGSKYTILVAEKLGEAGLKLLEDFANVDCSYNMTPEELITKASLCDALIVQSETKVGLEVFESSRGRLQVVGCASDRFDNVDLNAATRSGCLVVNTPKAKTIPAAEHAIALMAAMARNVAQADASVKAGEWERNKYVGVSLVGKTLAVLGLGKVGSEVARRAKGLGMRVIAHDPYVPAESAHAIGVYLVRFREAIVTADFISVHLPLTEKTSLILNSDTFARMKKGVRIVNVAHGGLIDEDALVKALDSGIVAQAALDVFSEDSKLVKHESVTVTPHLGASSMEAQEGAAIEIAQAVVAVLKGAELPAHAVNMFSDELPTKVKTYLELAHILGRMVAQLVAGGVNNVQITYGLPRVTDELDPKYVRAMIFQRILDPICSEVDVLFFKAKQRDLSLTEERWLLDGSPESLMETRTFQVGKKGEAKVEGWVKDGVQHLIKMGDLKIVMSCTL